MEHFFVEPRSVETRQGSYRIEPFRVRDLSRVARLSIPMIDMFSAAFEGTGNGQLYLKAIAAHTDSVIELIAICTGESVEKIGELYTDDLLAVLTETIMVNGDFFLAQVAPRLRGLFQAWGQPAGPTSSNT